MCSGFTISSAYFLQWPNNSFLSVISTYKQVHQPPCFHWRDSNFQLRLPSKYVPPHPVPKYQYVFNDTGEGEFALIIVEILHISFYTITSTLRWKTVKTRQLTSTLGTKAHNASEIQQKLLFKNLLENRCHQLLVLYVH